jgi:hypothetical protein
MRQTSGHSYSGIAMTRRLDEMESKYDAQFKVVFDAVRELTTPPERPRRHIGFGSPSVG